MTQTPVTVTYPLEQVLGRIEQKLDTLQKDVNDIKIGQTRLEAELKGEIKTIDTRLSNLEKNVDKNTTDIADIKTDIADLKGWRSFIVPFFTAFVAAALTGVINWAIRK